MSEARRVNRNYLRDPLQIGATIVGVTVVCGGAGWWVDSKIGTFPFGLMIGSVVGLTGVIYLNLLWLKDMDRQETENRKVDSADDKPVSS